jgi:alkylhydroperoxidase family enzyme
VWGSKLAGLATPEFSAALLRGEDEPLDDRERVLAQWARQVAAEPNAIRALDVQALRDNGYDDRQIMAITVYVAMRIAIATVNDALGARPDGQLRQTVPAPVLDAVKYGRPIATAHSA